MNYQWYPGHMTKARRMMQENIKLIDLVIELVDARIPISSRNPDIDELGQGKSRIILLNSFAGKACAKTGNNPGVTKGKQWIRLNKGLELLDTPGILWPKFEDQQVGMRLAFIGSMNDEILIPDELACDLIGAIKELYPKALQERYEADPAGKPIEILEAVAESRKCYAKGEQLDLGKAAGILIDDFRSGKLGRITLERI